MTGKLARVDWLENDSIICTTVWDKCEVGCGGKGIKQPLSELGRG